MSQQQNQIPVRQLPQQPQAGVSTVERVSRTAGHAAGTVLDAARHALETMRHPEDLVDRAKKLNMAAPMLRQAVTPLLTGHVDWKAEYAYTAGVQAFIYGFPYIYNAQIRHDWVTNPRDPEVVPYAAVNEFWHAARLLDATYRDGGCPNNDTLYSLAWLDLEEEPVILSHPDMGERYFTFELMGFTSDNFDYIGQRTTGPGAGDFAITGPNWKGKLPPDVQTVAPSTTPWVLVLGRTLVDGSTDLPNARALQQQFRLTPLSRWGKRKTPSRRRRRDVYAPVGLTEDPLGPWKTLNAMLEENPPPAHHSLVLDQFARIGIGPGLDVEDQPDVVKLGLTRAAAIGMGLLRQQFLSGDWATIVNGWRYPPPQEGRLGDDFLRRAADQSLAGITANDPAESVYLVNFDDADGQKLTASGRYELHFSADDLPPVDAFWSLAAYTAGDLNLIPNPAGRYSVGDRTAGLRRDPDGGLTIYLQPESPGPAQEANWLPTSASHDWFVILRLYRPQPTVIQATWRCPGISRVAEEKAQIMKLSAKLPHDDIGASLNRFEGVRGQRYTEIFLIGGHAITGKLVGGVYNTIGLNDPVGTGDTSPQAMLDKVDVDALKEEYDVISAFKNGPRLWTLDWVEVTIGVERDFNGLKARWVMWLDVPKEMRKHESVAYKAINGKRDTQLGINKGSPAFILDDPDGNSWVMKSASLILDPNQTYESLKDLGNRLHPAPGWNFRTVMLEKDLVLTSDNGAVHITQDDLGNTYDRVGGPFSNYKP
ncbi:MAG: DUF1254 domain-containing protein [Mycobacteriaceae bacterium]